MSGGLSVLFSSIGLFFQVEQTHEQAKTVFFVLGYTCTLIFAIKTAAGNYTIIKEKEASLNKKASRSNRTSCWPRLSVMHPFHGPN